MSYLLVTGCLRSGRVAMMDPRGGEALQTTYENGRKDNNRQLFEGKQQKKNPLKKGFFWL
jgi:hypothetical protein